MMYYEQFGYQPMRESSMGKSKEIRVTGEGIVNVQPDQAEVIIGIITEDKELLTAQKQNAQVTTAVIEALLQLQIPKEQIQTADFSIFPQYNFIDGVQTFKNYKVEHRLSVKTSNIDRIGLIVDTAVQSGANSIIGINFKVTERQKYEQQALMLAIYNATQKAITIAHVLRVQLIQPPVLIIEGASAPITPEPFYSTAMVKGVSTTPIEPGLLEMRANITAVFHYNGG